MRVQNEKEISGEEKARATLRKIVIHSFQLRDDGKSTNHSRHLNIILDWFSKEKSLQNAS